MPTSAKSGVLKETTSQETTSIKETLKKIDSLSAKEIPITENNNSPIAEIAEPKENAEISTVFLQECYAIFVENIKGDHPRLYSALKLITPELIDKTKISIHFQNNAQLEEFRLKVKPGLYSYLWSALNTEIEILDEIAEIEKLEKPLLYNDNDKLQHMIQKNPALQQLKSKFNLDFE
jgi:DNA polymerase-3 subunit gamma/tau